MTDDEHIIETLAEECGEVAKECSKANRFGLLDQLTLDPTGPRGTEGPTNADKIAEEMIDLLGVYQMAVERGLVVDIGLDRLRVPIKAKMAAKRKKVIAFMGYARRVGTLPT